MKLNKIEIKNYKSIKHQEVNLSDLTALVGQNNSGKSALLDAIQCFYGDKAITNEDYHMGSREDIVITLEFSDVTDEDIEKVFDYKSIVIKTNLAIEEKRDLLFSKNQLEKLEAFVLKETEKLEKTHREKFNEVVEKYAINIEDRKFNINCIKPYNNNVTFKTANGSTLKKADLEKLIPPIKVISAIRTPATETTAGTKSNLKELISMLEDRDDDNKFISIPSSTERLSYSQLKSLLSRNAENQCEILSKEITGFFQQTINTDSLSVKVKVDEGMKFDFKYKTVLVDKDLPDKEVDILSCGTGLQSMMILSILQTYIKRRIESDFILLIEEPEVYLHPSLQRKMINSLLEISNKNQIILTTHSPIIVGKIDQKNVICVSKNNGITTFFNHSAEVIIKDLGIQVSDILNKGAVIFVEGKDDRILVESIINKITGVPNFAQNQIDIIETNGFDKMDFYANASILHKDTVKTPYWVIVDSDGEKIEDRKKKLIEKGKQNGVHLVEDRFKVLNEYAIESYFLDPDLLPNTFSDLDFESIKELCDCYFLEYEVKLELLRKNQYDKKRFRSIYKPKIMFSNLDKQEDVILKILQKEYDTNERILQTRQRLINCWNRIENPIEHFINVNDLDELKKKKIGEIIEIISEIVNEIKRVRSM